MKDYYEHAGRAVFPEDQGTLDLRMESVMQQILNRFDGNILIISHASPVDSLFRLFLGRNPPEFQGMCAVSRFDGVSEGWVLGIDRDSSHLSINDNLKKVFYQELDLTHGADTDDSELM